MEPNKEQNSPAILGGASLPTIFLTLLIAVLMVAIVFWAISLGRKYQASSIEKKLASVEEETQGLGTLDKKAKAINVAVENLKNINQAKSHWSAFLTELANNTTKNVVLSEMTMNEERTIDLNGQTVSYEALAKFMSSLRSSSRFSNVTLINANFSANQGATPLNFDLRLEPSGVSQ